MNPYHSAPSESQFKFEDTDSFGVPAVKRDSLEESIATSAETATRTQMKLGTAVCQVFYRRLPWDELDHPTRSSTQRRPNINNVIVGLAPHPLGKTEVATTRRFRIWKTRKWLSTTPSTACIAILVLPPG